MGKGRTALSKKWLILGLLGLLFPLFQNMSPSDEAGDIRSWAPRKPAGEWDEPLIAYFPKNFSASSLSDVQQSFLSHNFDPMLKDLEMTYRLQDNRLSFGGEKESGILPDGNLNSNGRWKFGLINSHKLRFSYENQFAGQGLELVCEADSAGEGLSLKMNRPVTSDLHVGLTHETGRNASQVQIDYQW